MARESGPQDSSGQVRPTQLVVGNDIVAQCHWVSFLSTICVSHCLNNSTIHGV